MYIIYFVTLLCLIYTNISIFVYVKCQKWMSSFFSKVKCENGNWTFINVHFRKIHLTFEKKNDTFFENMF